MAGSSGGGRRRSGGATPGARRSSGRLLAPAPRGGPPWTPLPRRTQDSPVPHLRVLQQIPAPPPQGDPAPPPPAAERPLPPRRSPRLHSQKENVPMAASPSPAPLSPCPSPPPCAPPASPPPSPAPPAVAPRVRRSYSRLEPGPPRRLGGASPSRSPSPPPPAPPLGAAPPPAPPPALPGIGPAPERRKKKKVAPIDLGELEAWAARMNAQFEEAERFRLVVE